MKLFLIFLSNIEVGQVEYSTSTHQKRISIRLPKETVYKYERLRDTTIVYRFPQPRKDNTKFT
ncbi:hypothetical protein [Leptospira borgpetersenii]|uniref:KTSC domain protein n=1 Tax=Leptospira borgpetersenii serovar Javanica str. UI 09931 TaxID=1049767 RepID=A0AAV3JCV6_LEPBO|nr:hypothetical protein [Leptospira borgpetersenii]EPG58445.1 hypothetical protein LEP1GSC103_3023 [Leptospira borgpetersenii serovar Javanica str. UI 09931]AXX14588.1 hypothetical protein C4Q31_02440 [Leptospira borgpetersenii serovar Ceylonica]EKQ92044.1 hypothetical protein LEP1GSC101_3362 [Leptospira borgpetersenii str. UI 09149]MDQ7243477.1 hypothetical protein [Leptospira borgpetersenii]QVK47203.1 hypothetical protein FH601_12035 [Leptospira borgpetersenii]